MLQHYSALVDLEKSCLPHRQALGSERDGKAVGRRHTHTHTSAFEARAVAVDYKLPELSGEPAL